MNLKRTTIIFVGGAALAAWLSAAIAPSRPPVTPVVIAPAPIDASSAGLAIEIARLRERLRPTPAPHNATRNPFLFKSPRRGGAASLNPAPAATEITATITGGQNLARLTLAGIAEDPAPGGDALVRTAIISGGGQLFLAKESDVVSDGGESFTVTTISADSVELTSQRDGTTRRLDLK
jgi:hypothetical protein